MQKGIIIPEADISNRNSFHELCEKCSQINSDDVLRTAEPYEAEGWITVTWRWKESMDLEFSNVSKDTQVFYKLFRINKDFTYEYLDMITSKNFMLATTSFKAVGSSSFLWGMLNVKSMSHPDTVQGCASLKQRYRHSTNEKIQT